MTSRTFLPPLQLSNHRQVRQIPFGTLRNVTLLEYETRPITFMDVLERDYNLLEERTRIRQDYDERMETLRQEYNNTLRTYAMLRSRYDIMLQRERDEVERRQSESHVEYNENPTRATVFERSPIQNESFPTELLEITRSSLWVETMTTKHQIDAQILIDNAETCCICYEPYERINRIQFTQCGHHVCVDCKRNMEASSIATRCPLCNSS